STGRSFYVLDRTLWWEEPHVYSWTQHVNSYVASELFARGLTSQQVPYVAYYDDDSQDGVCQTGGWWFSNWSFVTPCTSWDIEADCRDWDQPWDPTTNACAWTIGGHNAVSFQPTVRIGAGLSDPIYRRNVTWHEMFHTLSSGHNNAEWSIMNSGVVDWFYMSFTSHDLDDIYWHYSHGVPE
ncbi:MAG: hypothetical protein ACRDIB_08175, partial [Ardenticatenaceae bacterium]